MKEKAQYQSNSKSSEAQPTKTPGPSGTAMHQMLIILIILNHWRQNIPQNEQTPKKNKKQ